MEERTEVRHERDVGAGPLALTIIVLVCAPVAGALWEPELPLRAGRALAAALADLFFSPLFPLLAIPLCGNWLLLLAANHLLALTDRAVRRMDAALEPRGHAQALRMRRTGVVPAPAPHGRGDEAAGAAAAE